MTTIHTGSRWESRATGFAVEVLAVQGHTVKYGWVNINGEADHTVTGKLPEPQFREQFLPDGHADEERARYADWLTS